MTLGHDFWDTIMIVIILNTLHDNFDIITTSLLEFGDKIINQI